MAIPDFQTIMLPLLELHSDGSEHLNKELVAKLSDYFELSDDERREMLPSGRAKLFDNRVGWAKFHTSKALALEYPRRAVSIITERGRLLLDQNPIRIDLAVLSQFDEYREFRNQEVESEENTPEVSSSETDTPEEMLDASYQKVRTQIEDELLELVVNGTPEFLEQVVVDLIVGMGYGGNRKDAGEALGRSGDEGIDGMIKEDPLGLDIIYLQAKRWKDNVGRPEIQRFAGALQGQRASKGIIITTSKFTREAEDYVRTINSKIILIDGRRLARLMFDHGIGVTTEISYEVKRIDTDYFIEN